MGKSFWFGWLTTDDGPDNGSWGCTGFVGLLGFALFPTGWAWYNFGLIPGLLMLFATYAVFWRLVGLGRKDAKELTAALLMGFVILGVGFFVAVSCREAGIEAERFK